MSRAAPITEEVYIDPQDVERFVRAGIWFLQERGGRAFRRNRIQLWEQLSTVAYHCGVELDTALKMSGCVLSRADECIRERAILIEAATAAGMTRPQIAAACGLCRALVHKTLSKPRGWWKARAPNTWHPAYGAAKMAACLKRERLEKERTAAA